MCSCQLFAHEEKVEFELPQWPEYLPELVGWEIALRQAQGPQAVPELVEGQGPQCKQITLRVDKNIPCSITATPLTRNQFFKPAGTIYPYSQKITWSGGYAAKIFNTISEHEHFNWEKLMETLENCENPWLLDSQEVLEGIAYHNFNANKLKLSKTISVPLDFTVYSSYVPQNQTILQNNTVLVIKNQPEIFALGQGSGTPDFPEGVAFYIIINASSAKNISLDLISMPILKEGL